MLTHPDAGARTPDPAHPPPASALLAGLTPEQADAVQHGPGPLLLLAGPGAGKTKTLIHRVAHLLATGRARAHEILAVTFSVRAAGELRLRLADLLGEGAARAVTAATFHSVCARILREHAGVFGRTDAYTVYDQGDVRRVIDWLLSDAQRGRIQHALRDVGQPAADGGAGGDLAGQEPPADPRAAGAHGRAPGRRAARRRLARNGARAAPLQRRGLRRSAVLRGQAAGRAPAPPRLLPAAVAVDRRRRVPGHQRGPGRARRPARRGRGNVACVADDDQLVYSFRGAEPRNILGFADRFPGHHTIVLGRNFRCRAEILDPAVACVQHNLARAPKALIAMRGPGGHVQVHGFASERQEAEWIAGLVADALQAGTTPAEVLILARTGYATGPVQHALAHAGIAHRVLGALGLYERSEIRDALAYLTLLANPADAQAFRRAIGSPRRGVGTATANRIVAHARADHDGDMIRACARAGALEGIRGQAADRVARFGEGLEHVRCELGAGRSLGHAVVATVMLDGGLVRHFEQRRDRSPKAEERRDADRVLEDLRSLCRAAQAFEHHHPEQATLTAFLEHAAGLHAHELGAGEEDRRLTVSTIHRAKGTEAALVVLCGCEERLLPSWRSLADPDPGVLEEERRLFYVAATRAKDHLVITHAAARHGRPTGGPSRFLTEAGLTGSGERQLAA